jgi:DNA-binding response OmpR family regulator
MILRKTNFEVVPLTEIAPLLQATRPRAILSVSYDASLAHTREMLLSSSGFHVFSALTVPDAVRASIERPFDLVVIGHSIPIIERQALVKALRSRCSAPILALLVPHEPELAGADYCFDSTENPALLVETVKNIFRSRNGKR